MLSHAWKKVTTRLCFKLDPVARPIMFSREYDCPLTNSDICKTASRLLHWYKSVCIRKNFTKFDLLLVILMQFCPRAIVLRSSNKSNYLSYMPFEVRNIKLPLSFHWRVKVLNCPKWTKKELPSSKIEWTSHKLY